MTEEMEARVAALEMVVLEMLADLPPNFADKAIERIAGGMFVGEERLVRTHAVAILQAALRRNDPGHNREA